MDFIKNAFTIKDLENLSGVKKHTIRIWEKRYNLLSPERTKTNIRYYSTASLTHLLNVVLLYDNGYKISAIAKLSRTEILDHCKSLVADQAEKNQFINDMKLAMLQFDQQLFEKAYQKVKYAHTFSEIFQNYFIPLLNEIGFLWQTETINPAHEHFISTLIKQKILIHTEKLAIQDPDNKDYKFILFLPDNEIHDIGITFLNYEILNSGYQSIFLGQSVPISCLSSFSSDNAKLIFISYFTVKPDANKMHDYLQEIDDAILSVSKAELWILGYLAQRIDQDQLSERIKVFQDMPEALKAISAPVQ